MAPVRINPPPQLYGRSDLLASVRAVLAPSGARRAVLYGRSGIGKTAVLEHFAAAEDARTFNVRIAHEIEGPAFPLGHVLARLVAQLLDAEVVGGAKLNQVLSEIARNPAKHTWAILRGVISDSIQALAPQTKETVKAVMASVEAGDAGASPDFIAERIVEKGRDDILVSFITLIQALADTGVSGLIIFDRVEVASENVRGALRAISSQLPATWALLIALNDERQEGIDALSDLQGEFANDGAAFLPVEPLSKEAVLAWAQDVCGQRPPETVVEEAVRLCGGRALYIKEWIGSEDLSRLPEPENIQARLGGFYERRWKALPPEAQSILRSLAILPGKLTVPAGVCARLSRKQSLMDGIRALEDLRQRNFLKPADLQGDLYTFVHEELQNHIRAQIPRSLVKELARETLDAIGESGAPNGDLYTSYVMFRLHQAAGNREEVLRAGALIAPRLRQEGSDSSAGEVFAICRDMLRDRSSTEYLSCLIGEAETLTATGDYLQSLSRLADVGPIGPDHGLYGELRLAEAEANLRLNRYDMAQEAASTASAIFAKRGELTGEVEAKRVTIMALRDLERYAMAVTLAEALVGRCREPQVGSKLLGRSLRSLARCLALHDPAGDAIVAAEEALRLAQASQAVREIGNAHLAAGEALRHGGDQSNAAERYSRAIEFAKKVGNRDSLLWAALGKSDSLFLIGDLRRAMETLAEVGEIVSRRADHHPLEFLHWKLSSNTLRFAEDQSALPALKEAASAYRQFGISWPMQYVEHLSKGTQRMPPKKL